MTTEKSHLKNLLTGKGGLDYLDKDLFKNIKLEIFKPKVKDYYTTLCHI